MISQQNQQIGIGQNGRPRREIVIVSDLDFGRCHGIIFIDDGNNTVREQCIERVTRIQIALAIFQIGTCQQHLANMQLIDVEQTLPDLNQMTLPDGRQHLLIRHGRRKRGMPQ